MLYDPSHYVLQNLDYLAHIDIYHEKIKMFHVKDELNPTGKQGVYGGFNLGLIEPVDLDLLVMDRWISNQFFQSLLLMVMMVGLFLNGSVV